MVGDILLVFGPLLIGIYVLHWLFLPVSLWLIDDSLCDSYLMSDIVGVAGATCDGATCMVLCEPGKMAIGRRRTKCRWNRKSGFFWKRVSLSMKLNPRFVYDPVSKSHDLCTIYPWSIKSIDDLEKIVLSEIVDCTILNSIFLATSSLSRMYTRRSSFQRSKHC